MNNCGKPARWLMLLLALAGFSSTGWALEIRETMRFVPEAGRIADAAIIGSNHLALLYPDEGRIADYAPDGTLYQHIVREAGVYTLFRPVACTRAADGALRVYDEAAMGVLTILADGNTGGVLELVYPFDGKPTVLSRVSGLARTPDGVLWTILPDLALAAGFDREGALTKQIALTTPEHGAAAWARPQCTADGTLFVLDYHAGALYRLPDGQARFERVPLPAPAGLDAAPVVQDFAVDDAGRILLARSGDAPLSLLLPGAGGYTEHPLVLDFPAGRIACRQSAGKLILWSRSEPMVCVLQLQ